MCRIIVALTASGVLAACSSVYHPEYHPVTVTQYSQTVSAPVSPASGPPPAVMNVLPPQLPPADEPE